MLGGNAVNLDAFSFLLMPSRLSRPLRGSAARVIWAAARLLSGTYSRGIPPVGGRCPLPCPGKFFQKNPQIYNPLI
jgi:hypothetical protein